MRLRQSKRWHHSLTFEFSIFLWIHSSIIVNSIQVSVGDYFIWIEVNPILTLYTCTPNFDSNVDVMKTRTKCARYGVDFAVCGKSEGDHVKLFMVLEVIICFRWVRGKRDDFCAPFFWRVSRWSLGECRDGRLECRDEHNKNNYEDIKIWSKPQFTLHLHGLGPRIFHISSWNSHFIVNSCCP